MPYHGEVAGHVIVVQGFAIETNRWTDSNSNGQAGWQGAVLEIDTTADHVQEAYNNTGHWLDSGNIISTVMEGEVMPNAAVTPPHTSVGEQVGSATTDCSEVLPRFDGEEVPLLRG